MPQCSCIPVDNSVDIDIVVCVCGGGVMLHWCMAFHLQLSSSQLPCGVEGACLHEVLPRLAMSDVHVHIHVLHVHMHRQLGMD